MASPSSIMLQVPKELAINTNHPNASSVVIDLAAQETGGRRRRSMRQTKPPSNNMVKNTNGSSPSPQHQYPTTSAAHPRGSPDTCLDFVAKEKRPRQTAKSNSSNSEHSSKKMKSSNLRSPTSSSSLTSTASSTSIGSSQQREASFAAASKRLDDDIGHSSSEDNESKRNITTTKRIAYRPQNTNKGADVKFSPSVNTAQSSSSSAARTSTRNTAVRKSAKRLALEAHLLVHDAHGTVRFNHDNDMAPYNAREPLESIKGMFDNESLMQRIQVMYDERVSRERVQRRQHEMDDSRNRRMYEDRARRMYRQESQRRLEELGKRMPWVLTQFELYEEYEAWAKDTLRRGVQQACEQGDLEVGLDPDDSCTGHTTEDDTVGTSVKTSQSEEADAANMLLQLHDADTRLALIQKKEYE